MENEDMPKVIIVGGVDIFLLTVSNNKMIVNQMIFNVDYPTSDVYKYRYNKRQTLTKASGESIDYDIENYATLLDRYSSEIVLETARLLRFNVIEGFFNTAVANMSNAKAHEMSTWTKQEAESRAWLADNNSRTILIDSIIAGRGNDISKLDYVNLIIRKADEYEAAYGMLLGAYRKLISTLELCTTVDEISNVRWTLTSKNGELDDSNGKY